MKHILNRTIVTAENKTLLRGSDVTGLVSEDTLRRWIADGFVSQVEDKSDFMDKVNKKGKKVDPEVEKLDPDAEVRSK